MTKLNEEDQLELTRKINGQLEDQENIDNLLAEKKSKAKPAAQRKRKTVNEHLEAAQKNLKKAIKLEGEPDKVMIAQMKVYLMELEEKLNSKNDF